MFTMSCLLRKDGIVRAAEIRGELPIRHLSQRSGAFPVRVRTRFAGAGALLLLVSAGVLGGCISGGGGHHNGTGANNQIIDLNSDVTVDNQPDAPNLNFTAGTNATLHFLISNVGDKPSDQLITITATLPGGLTYVSYTSISSGNWTCSPSGQTITCTSSVSVAGLAMGVAIFDVSVKVASGASGNAQLPVTISTNDGTPSSNSGAKGVIITNASPSISSLNPTSGNAGTAVTITGAHFGATQGSSSVSFANHPATIASWSDTSIVADVPGGIAAGTAAVVVTVNTAASNVVTFTVTGPQITSLSPSSGPIGTAVTIAGSNFGSSQGSSTVSFNGTSATTITSWTNTSIVATVPAAAMTGVVEVTVAGVSSAPSSAAVFSVTSTSGACTGGGSAAGLLVGDYTFSGQGFTGGTNAFNALIGRFHADGVNTISSGLLEGLFEGNEIGTAGVPVPFTGCFVLDTPTGASGDALGTLTIVNTSTSINITIAIAVRTTGDGNWISYDATSPVLAGNFEKQCPNAANGSCQAFSLSSIAGDYAFGFDGILPGTSTSNYAVAGRLTANNGAMNGAVMDVSSYAGVDALNDGFSAGYTMQDFVNGHAEIAASLNWNAGNANGTHVGFNFDCYLSGVNGAGVATTLYCINTVFSSQVPVLIGRFVKSSTPAGGWTLANTPPASNASVIFSTGVNGSGNARVDVGQFTYNSSASPATISISQDQNHGGSYVFQQGLEDISVASNGRVEATVSGTVAAVCYLHAPGAGFCVNEANNAALGYFVPQEAEPPGGFTMSGLANSFALGTLFPATGSVVDTAGVLTATGAAGTLGGPESINSTSGHSAPLFAGTYSIMSAADAAIGRFTVTETSPANDTLILYMIDANTAVVMSTTSTEPAVLYLKH